MSCECNQTAYEKILASEAIRQQNEAERISKDEVRESEWDRIRTEEAKRAETFENLRAFSEEEIEAIITGGMDNG